MLNEQEIFTKAYEGLKAQGFEKSAGYDLSGNFTCMYRFDNLKCAIGQCIPDERYNTDLENIRARDPMIRRAAGIHPDVPDRWLVDLQHCHDASLDPEDMKLRLSDFARFYDLKIED
jgi:hypothetical protein